MDFPTTDILDTFSVTSGPPPTGWAFMALDNQRSAYAAGGEMVELIPAGNAIASLYWTAESFDADQEVYCTELEYSFEEFECLKTLEAI